MKKTILLAGLLLLLTNCKNKLTISSQTREYLNSQLWQYDSGFKLTDRDGFCLEQNTKLEVRSDTFFFQSNPIALITKIDSIDHVLEVESIESKEDGRYYSTKALNH